MKTENLIQEAINQIEHLHEKYGETGSGNQVLAKLKAYKPQPLSDEMRGWIEGQLNLTINQLPNESHLEWVLRTKMRKGLRMVLNKANEL